MHDPSNKRITVKGTGDLDAATELTVADQPTLTVRRQDQRFDLGRLTTLVRATTRRTQCAALIEGDAVRVEGLYEDQMSEVDQQAAHTQQQSDAGAADREAEAQAIPSMLLALFEAPYVFGPTMVRVADNGRGTGANGLFRNPPANDAAFFDPSTLVEHAEFVKVPVPKLDKGDRKVGQPDGFGPVRAVPAPRLAGRPLPVAPGRR